MYNDMAVCRAVRILIWEKLSGHHVITSGRLVHLGLGRFFFS